MMHKAWSSIEEVPYCVSRSAIKFQTHTGWKIEDLNPIWVRLLGRLQLSNPSDLPCYTLPKFYQIIFVINNISLYAKYFVLSCSIEVALALSYSSYVSKMYHLTQMWHWCCDLIFKCQSCTYMTWQFPKLINEGYAMWLIFQGSQDYSYGILYPSFDIIILKLPIMNLWKMWPNICLRYNQITWIYSYKHLTFPCPIIENDWWINIWV